ncbi:MAG: tRNA pseudouridine(55) synthase TruB [Elusimicrobiaceae bacterium]|nr:tRNA pseudouridine(55) synthase TruB [Elusimicrobiaceae bacterium]
MSSKIFNEPQRSGLLLIDKPADFSSHDIIAIVRRVLATKKIGHSGTLDPMATGLLILLVGRQATQQQDRFLQLSKTYQATLKLGEETSSWDAYGEIVRTCPIPPLSLAQIQQAAEALTGTVRQPVPFYSAKRIHGERMYELARKGVPIERKFNEVTVSWNDLHLSTPNEITFSLQGSCGTYVRSMGFLLAEKLGTVGHLTALRRIAIGPYHVEDALDGRLLKTCSMDELYQRVQPL